MGIWHGQQPGDKTGNSWRTNGHLWLWKLFLGNNKSNKLQKTWPRAGKCDGCQQKIGLIIRRKKIKTHKTSGVMDNEGQYLYLFGQKHNATSLLDCGQHLKVFTLSVGYYLEMAKEHPDLGDSLEDTAAPRIWPCLPGKLWWRVTNCTHFPWLIWLLLAFWLSFSSQFYLDKKVPIKKQV